MKHSILKKFGLFLFSLGVLIFFMFFSAPIAQAITPTLSLAGTGDGDSVQISVTGDPSTSVLFVYNKSGSGQQISSIGTTNVSGTLTTTVSSSSYGIPSGALVYVATGSINGPQSATVAWPAVASLLSPSNMLSLSQTGLVLSVGQTATITASNLNSSSLYLSGNSSPIIANFNISGSQITVLANSYGSTTGTFCLINNTANCGSVYVIVQNSSAQPLTFSQSSISLSPGQTIAIQISGGSGSYSVLNNSSQNNGVVTTNISGSNITLTTTSTAGSSSITVCSADMTSCGIINVTIGNAISSAVSFSQANPTITVGQSLNISIFGPANSFYYVASNSNPNIVQANLSGSTLTLLGITNGSSVLSICATANNCGSLTVTVNSNSTSGGKLTLSRDSVNLSTGQTASVTISGGSMPYNILSNVNNIVQSNLDANVLTLYGLNNGTNLMNVCSYAGNCATLSVTVSSSAPPADCTGSVKFSMTTGQLCANYVASAAPAALPADCLGTTQYSAGTGQLCTNYVAPAAPAPVVSPPATTTNATTSAPAKTTKTTTFKFTKSIKQGSSGTEVSELQKKLSALGYYKSKVDGKFGPTTDKAVKAFQKAHKIPQVGNVGPQTRSLLNK